MLTEPLRRHAWLLHPTWVANFVVLKHQLPMPKAGDDPEDPTRLTLFSLHAPGGEQGVSAPRMQRVTKQGDGEADSLQGSDGDEESGWENGNRKSDRSPVSGMEPAHSAGGISRSLRREARKRFGSEVEKSSERWASSGRGSRRMPSFT